MVKQQVLIFSNKNVFYKFFYKPHPQEVEPNSNCLFLHEQA